MSASCSSSTNTAWSLTYDANGNVLNQTDPRNITTYTSYDSLNRALCNGTSSAQVNPCTSAAYSSYFYDRYNNTSTPGVAFPAGCSAPASTSTPLGKMVAETFSGAAGNGWRCSGYDARGETVASGLSVTADGQTTTQNVSTTYDDRGLPTGMTYPNGEQLTSAYDSKGFLRSIYFGTPSSTDPVAFLLGQASYTNTGQIAGLSLGGSAAKTSVPTPVFSTTLSYDGIQRPVSSTATLGGASRPFWSQSRTLDNIGNVLQLSTTLPTSSGGSLTDNQSFCYDALDRLTWAGNTAAPSGGDHCGSAPGGSTTTGYAQSFSYDAIDRMTQGSAGTQSYGDAGHVHAATGLSSIPNPYAGYDAMGNMTCRNVDTTGSQSCASGTQTGATMSYDNEGRLAGWNAPTGIAASVQFLYDNEGNRVLQRSSTGTVGSTTPTITDTLTFNSYSDVTITNGISVVTNYYMVAGQRVALRKGAMLSYLLPDFLGGDNIALNYDGTVQAVQLFAPYGSVRYSDQIMPTDYSFTGQRLDGTTGLLYYNARYYDPVGGRFTSADTVQNNMAGLDPYAYVADNPETRIDPTGHRFTMNDSGGPPGIDDTTASTQLFSDIQNYLNSQNPYLSFAEETAVAATAPIWIPTLLVVVILSIPSDSSQPDQSQNTSISPTPEATPATDTSGAGARKGNNSDSEQYIRDHLPRIIPSAGNIVDSGSGTDVHIPGRGKTDIDVESEHAVISVGAWSKFYNQKTGQYDQKVADKFWSAVDKYSAYATSVGKKFIFAYDMRWSSLDIPDKVLRTLEQKNIPVVRFDSSQ